MPTARWGSACLTNSAFRFRAYGCMRPPMRRRSADSAPGEEVGLGGEQQVLAAVLGGGTERAGQALDAGGIVEEDRLGGDAVDDGPMVVVAVEAEDDGPAGGAIEKGAHRFPEGIEIGGGLAAPADVDLGDAAVDDLL